jgi:hypothetical protein
MAGESLEKRFDMKARDPVGEFLQKRGCPEHVVRGGLLGLTENWENVVRSVEEGYSLGLDDYLNDMDGRQLIEESLPIAPAGDKEAVQKRLRQADAKLQWLVKPAGRCLWGDETAQREGWTANKNWWYFSIPTRPGEDLLREIEKA